MSPKIRLYRGRHLVATLNVEDLTSSWQGKLRTGVFEDAGHYLIGRCGVPKILSIGTWIHACGYRILRKKTVLQRFDLRIGPVTLQPLNVFQSGEIIVEKLETKDDTNIDPRELAMVLHLGLNRGRISLLMAATYLNIWTHRKKSQDWIAEYRRMESRISRQSMILI
jgi:hypothetical protein